MDAKSEERPQLKILSKLITCLDKSFYLLRSYSRIEHYTDEVKFHHFGGKLQNTANISDGHRGGDTNASGFSPFSEETALLKFIGESIERFCANVYKKNKFVYGSYNELSSKALNPTKIVALSNNQLKDPVYEKFVYDKDTKFYWTKGVSLMTDETVLVPAQLVYLSYRFRNEKIIYLPITTGAAGGSSYLDAIRRGICEIIEREAFIIFYLNKLTPPRIDLRSLNHPEINHFLYLFKRYKLVLNVLDITTDVRIPTFLTVVIDRTGIGSAVSTGLKTHLNPIKAILGSIIESLHPRCWIRGIVEADPQKQKKN